MGDTTDDAHDDETPRETTVREYATDETSAVDFVRDSDAGDAWGTPPRIVDPLSKAIGGFDLDPASGAEPKPYADVRFTKEDDGLSRRWVVDDVDQPDVWFNPPYGREANPKWGKKALQEFKSGDVGTITALLPGNTGTEWFGKYYAPAGTITHLHERVEFHGAGDDGATFDSVIVSFGDFPDEYYDALSTLGTVYDRHFETDQTSVSDFA